ncbi:cytochrome c biogenesis heme-transporting ATPase CcmA [soil metagenome]
MAKSILQVDNLAYERNDNFLFSKLSFQLQASQALHIEGINGAGKTTLLRILTGLVTPTDGIVYWQGKNIQECREEYHSQLLYIGHHAAIKGELTPRENLQANLALCGNHSNCSIETALLNLGLENYANFPCHQLSAGQQRRVALARLWLTAAKVWILDEPFAAIDKTGVTNVSAVMVEHLTQGGVLVITSHQPLSLQNCSLRRLLLE